MTISGSDAQRQPPPNHSAADTAKRPTPGVALTPTLPRTKSKTDLTPARRSTAWLLRGGAPEDRRWPTQSLDGTRSLIPRASLDVEQSVAGAIGPRTHAHPCPLPAPTQHAVPSPLRPSPPKPTPDMCLRLYTPTPTPTPTPTRPAARMPAYAPTPMHTPPPSPTGAYCMPMAIRLRLRSCRRAVASTAPSTARAPPPLSRHHRFHRRHGRLRGRLRTPPPPTAHRSGANGNADADACDDPPRLS